MTLVKVAGLDELAHSLNLERASRFDVERLEPALAHAQRREGIPSRGGAVIREIAPGMKAHLWGYNGQSPGPTIEVVEGDRVRMFVTNRLSEHTSIHWHGQRMPNGMDGVSGLNQQAIKPGQSYGCACRQRRASMGGRSTPRGTRRLESLCMGQTADRS